MKTSARENRERQLTECPRLATKINKAFQGVGGYAHREIVFQVFRTQSSRPTCDGLGLHARWVAQSVAAADPSEKLAKALAFKPRQADVNYENVKPDQLADCAIEEMVREDGKGFMVTGPGAVPLRWFVDTNKDNRLDRWCYFNAGVEVYENPTPTSMKWPMSSAG